ncbi:PREDICTED: uncharacterized protein LOC104743796 [Camelina sativa]|uniref:Uncharacterized protein LOC104743796 n=1 Tax=Camelina sativa TaxID=90675 RepID=A0ABM0VYM1_CAMSA|nr:PREDICTED: uncharacterized protein LOC104743796 [Camelina sativa]
MALKLDIAKAFDKVEWNYLEAILKKLGFADKWCNWVMKCITTVSYSVLINGSPSKKIIPQRGLRQGDPLSPYLYLLCTEGLSSLISTSVKANHIHGFRASRNGPAISHMLFADDSLLFCKADEEECNKLLDLLKIYASASGQHVNFQKSAILFGKNIHPNTQQNIKNLTGIIKVGGFGKYLGLPEAIGRDKSNVFTYISQRLQNKLNSWYSKFLSPGGKEVLIKVVATAIPTYTMSCFLLPKKITAHLSGQIRKFWWSGVKDKYKIPWVAWSKLTRLKQYGGLGFKDLHQFNVALLAKQAWRMLKEPQSLLSRVLQAKYFSKSKLMEANLGHRPSHAWRSIHQGIQLIKKGLKWRIGDGNTVRIWSDQWIDNPPRPARRSHQHHQNLNSLKVVDLMKPNTSQWSSERLHELIHPEDIKYIQRIRSSISKVPDTPTWIFTNNGHYSVGSLHTPPKIKHFWWRALHNALPVAETLSQRCIKVLRDCNLCGEALESITHLLFQCRVAKEIWELSPIPINPGQLDPNCSLIEYIQKLLSLKNEGSLKEYIFPFIGWRIWKARNDLLYNNKRWAIPDIINKALMDYRLWREANNGLRLHVDATTGKEKSHVSTNCVGLNQPSSFYCYTDGSWLNNESKAGIGWTLHYDHGKCILKGSSSIAPTNSALETEAFALREALLHIKRLDYHPVIFCGDSKVIYTYLEKAQKQDCLLEDIAEVQGYLEDILALSSSLHQFRYVGRKCNALADVLAKEVRIKNSPLIISWVC